MIHGSSIQMMIKPAGAVCNLACDYCYYLGKEGLYEKGPGGPGAFRMSQEVLEQCIRDYIDSQGSEEVTFVWQGGEPMMLGIEFFRKALAFQEKYADGRRISNSIQTNGTLINEEWAEFMSRHQFLVGISIDGPCDLHNHHRKYPSGKGSFTRVLHGVDLLRKRHVSFNTLTTVHDRNSRMPLRVYRFLKDLGSRHMQFIPIVERASEEADGLLSPVPVNDHEKAWVTEETVEPLNWGKFLSRIFDEWVRIDIGRVYVNYFDNTLAPYIGEEPAICTTRMTCGNAPVLEHNGDLYACDHYVYPEFLLGNIRDKTLEAMVQDWFLRDFGQKKQDLLPAECRQCEFLKACGGDCPKHRFIKTESGEYISYLHDGFLYFFNHADKYMRMMAHELMHRRPAEQLMEKFPEKERKKLLERSKSIVRPPHI